MTDTWLFEGAKHRGGQEFVFALKQKGVFNPFHKEVLP